MADPKVKDSKRSPWHLWVIGILYVLWSAMGALDYVMTQTKNEAYVSKLTPEQIAYFYGFPAWVVAAWAIGVWGGVAGALLLLFRRRLAVWIFLASLLALVVTNIHNYFLSNGREIFGGAGAIIFTSIIFILALLLVLYARAMQKRGVLV